MQTAAQSHPTGSTQAHVFNLTAASNNTSDGTETNSNSSSSAAATKTSTPGGSFAAAAQLREVLDRLRQEVYYSDSGAVSDLDSSVCDESRCSSLVCVDTDAACVAIPSATSTAAEREAVESSRGESELERDASSTRPKISQNQTEACQQTATENTRLEDSTSTERLQEPSQTDVDLCALQICELHTAVAGPNSEGVLANRQKFRDPGDASLIKERRASSGSHFSQQKPRSKRQSKGRKGRRRNQHQSVHTEDRSTMNHSLHRLQHDRDCKPGSSKRDDPDCKPGSSKRDERKDTGIPALASHEPSAHGQHRPSTTDSIATQLCTRAENTQVQFNTAFNYQEVVQFLQKGKAVLFCLFTHLYCM